MVAAYSAHIYSHNYVCAHNSPLSLRRLCTGAKLAGRAHHLHCLWVDGVGED